MLFINKKYLNMNYIFYVVSIYDDMLQAIFLGL